MQDSVKKRVCHLSSVHWAYDTRIHYRMCSSLTERYEVFLVACNGGVDEVSEAGVQIKSYKRYKSRIFRVFTSWLFVFIKAMKINAKLYHLHDPELIPAAFLLRLMGKKVILDIHENVAEDIFDKEWIKFPRLYYNVLSFFEYFVLKSAYIVLAEKSYEKRYKKRAKNYKVIYNYCNYPFFESYQNEDRSPSEIFYSGILFENRGMLQIAEALYLLKKDKGLVVNFHCVGELYHELRIKLESLSFWDEIKGQMTFYGRKKIAEAYSIGKHCGVGLSIIHPMSNSVESYPTKIFEYMACGMATIASDFPLYKSIVSEVEVGSNVNPLSAQELADAIFEMNADVDKWSKFCARGIVLAKANYNWESEKEKLFEVYKELID